MTPPVADIEPIGTWERATQPLINKFRLHGELGLEITLSSDASKATAEAFEKLVRVIDAQAACHDAFVKLLKSGGMCLAFLALLVAAAVAA